MLLQALHDSHNRASKDRVSAKAMNNVAYKKPLATNEKAKAKNKV